MAVAIAAHRAHRPPVRQPSFTSKEHPGKHRPARPVCKQTRLLSGSRVVIVGSCDQGSDEGAEQGLSPTAGVVDELEEAEIGGQLLLGDTAMWP
jgi:hypothetical protein